MRRGGLFLGVFILTLSLASAFSGGSGTIDDPFQVGTCVELQEIGDSVYVDKGLYFIQINDIDCSDTVNWNEGAGFVPIGRGNPSGFQGQYNGQDYAIFNLYINTPLSEQTGLFNFLGSDYFVSRINLVSATIYGGEKTGGVVGYANSIVSYSSVIGSKIYSNFYGKVGGIVGETHPNNGLVVYCRNVDSYVSGFQSAGGIVGFNGGKIENSYSTGSVSGAHYSGGLVGLNGGSVSNSYSTGSVFGEEYAGGLIGVNPGFCVSSFWDVETSGQITSDCGIGKITNEMKTYSTFTDAGWDFDNIWGISSWINNGYPNLGLRVFLDSDNDGMSDEFDCQPLNPAVHQGAEEICNGIDDNCDGDVDEGCYEWSGFLKPVDNLPMLNLVKAGSAVPIKFSLNGDKGLDIFDSNPVSCWTSCDSSLIGDVIEETSTAGQSTLSYNPLIDEYTYVWKTEKYWKGSCRKFTLNLNDGTSHSASFEFK